MDQPNKLADLPEEQYRISTTELLDKQVDVNKAWVKRGAFSAMATTLVLGGAAALTSGNASAMCMALYGAALFPQVNFIIYNIRNIRAARKRQKALENGTFDESFEETEEELRKKLLEGLKEFLKNDPNIEEGKGFSK